MGSKPSRPESGYVSKWYSPNDIKDFLNDTQLGDAIEFKRPLRMYRHWAIYVGEYEGEHCVVHASSPSNANFLNVVMAFSSMNKRVHNLGTVVAQSIYVAADGCSVRINNKMDLSKPPNDHQEIVQRAFDAIKDDEDYHLLKNNCEHFVNGWRYGKKESRQVDRVLGWVYKAVAAVGVGVFLWKTGVPRKT